MTTSEQLRIYRERRAELVLGLGRVRLGLLAAQAGDLLPMSLSEVCDAAADTELGHSILDAFDITDVEGVGALHDFVDILGNVPVIPLISAYKDPDLAPLTAALWAGKVAAKYGATAAAVAVVTSAHYGGMVFGGLWQSLGWFAPSLGLATGGVASVVGVLAIPIANELREKKKRAVDDEVYERASQLIARLATLTEPFDIRRWDRAHALVDAISGPLEKRERSQEMLRQLQNEHFTRPGDVVNSPNLPRFDGYFYSSKRERLSSILIDAVLCEGSVRPQEDVWLKGDAPREIGWDEDDIKTKWPKFIQDEARRHLQRQTYDLVRIISMAWLKGGTRANDTIEALKMLRPQLSNAVYDGKARAALRDLLTTPSSPFLGDTPFRDLLQSAQDAAPGLPILRSVRGPLMNTEILGLFSGLAEHESELVPIVDELDAKDRWAWRREVENLVQTLAYETDHADWPLRRVDTLRRALRVERSDWEDARKSALKATPEIQIRRETILRALKEVNELGLIARDEGMYLVGFKCPSCQSTAVFLRATRNYLRRNVYKCLECAALAVMEVRGSDLVAV